MARFVGGRRFAGAFPGLVQRQIRRGYRPRLEVLEDRTLLASFGSATSWGSPYEKAIAVDRAGDVFVPTPSVLWKLSASDLTGRPLWAVNYGALNIPGPNGNGGGSGSAGVGGGLGAAAAMDAAGNVYVASASLYFTSVEKFDGASGQLLWVRALGTSNPEDPYGSINCSSTGLAVDPSGNIYITGSFNTSDTFTHHLTLTFWSGPAFQAPAISSNVAAASPQPLNLYQPYAWGPGAFVAELDSSGQLVWDGALLNTGPGPAFRNYYVNANGVSTDAAGNVYIAGGFAGTANFDPNGGSHVLTNSNASLNPTSYPFPPDAFALKLNASHQLVWVDDVRAIANAQGSGSAGNSEAHAIASDAAGNVYLAGGFGGNVYFDPASGSHQHSEESSYAFVEKLDTHGSFQWFAEVTGSPAVGQAIALDPAGNIFSTGFFKNNVYLPTYFGAALVKFEGQWDTNAYVWQLDANGNTTWAGQLGGPNTFVGGYAIGIDAAGDIFAAGQMEADPNNVPEFTAVPVYFDPGPGGAILQTNSFGQSFLVKLNQNTPPTANAGGPYTIYEGNSLSLDASASTDPDGDSLHYSWDINGDGIDGDATGVSPTLSWAQLQALGITDPGIFNVSVQVDDGYGNVVTSAAITLTVQNASPTATIAPPSSGVVGQVLAFLFRISGPSPVDLAAGFTCVINWGDGTPLQTVAASPGNGSGITVNHVFTAAGSFPVEVTATDQDGEGGTTTLAAPLAVMPAGTTTAIAASADPSVNGQVIALSAAVSVNRPGAGIPTGNVTFWDGATVLGTATLDATGIATLSTDALGVGDHAITATYDGDGNFLPSSAALTQTVNPMTATNLQQVLSSVSAITIHAGGSIDAANVITAVNGLPAQGIPVTVTAILAAGVYSDLVASPPPGVTLVIAGQGTATLVGQSPALTVTTGTVVVSGLSLTTATASPTILVTLGSLTLRNDVVQESTGFTESAIVLAGGTLDLGTAGSPGNNLVNVNGAGEFVHNTTPTLVPAIGDTFASNGAPLLAPYLSFTSVSSSLASSVFGQSVTWTAAVTPDTTGAPAPGGSVDFFDTTSNTDLGTALLSGGVASWTTSALGVGAHAIVATYAGDNNYLSSLDGATQMVSPAALTVRADDTSKSYGAAIPIFTDTITGFVNGDNASVVRGGPTLTTTATTSSVPNTYAITVGRGTLAAANYTFNLVNGTLTVAPAPLSATGVNLGATAGAPFNGVVATFTNADPFGDATSYTATIGWGDGSTSAGVIGGRGNTLTVSGGHTYADPGRDSVTVQIVHNRGYTTTATATAAATVRSLGIGVGDDQTARIEFWHGRRGQALIASFNGGATSTELSDWLVTNFANLYGAGAGASDLTGKTNAQVAAFFETRWDQHHDSADVQVLATALNIFATTTSLGGAQGQTYGFAVTAAGLGASSLDVGDAGAAFGVDNHTKLNVFELLQDVNRRTVAGRLYNGDDRLRDLAEDLFEKLNRGGK